MAIGEVPRRCSIGYRTGSTLARAVYGLHLIYGSPVWGRLRTKRRCTVTQWSLAACRCLFRMGHQYGRWARGVNRLRWLRMVCVDIRPLWRPGFPTTVPVDGLHWSHRCLRRICQVIDGVVLGGSLIRGWFQMVLISWGSCLNHRFVVCGTLKRLAPSTVLKLVCNTPTDLSLSTMVGP